MTSTLQKKSSDATVTEPFLEKFRHFESAAKSSLLPFRKAGLALFAELGFPTLQHEDWRFTNVAPITKLPFKPVFEASFEGIGLEQINSFTFGKLPACRLVFINGHYSTALSSAATLPQGVIATSLGSAL